MTPRRGATRWLALAAAAGALGGLALVRQTGSGPPLYDGLCLPPHYLALGTTPGPMSASKTYSSADLAGTLVVATGEQVPQAQLIVAAGSISVPAGSSATVSLTPVQPPAVAPTDGAIAGNAYDVEARDPAGHALALAAGHPAILNLEAPSAAGPQLTIERFDGSRWAPLKTFQSGCGSTYDAAPTALGVFALVAQRSGGGSNSGGSQSAGGSSSTVLIVVAVVVGALVLIIGAARLGRRRR